MNNKIKHTAWLCALLLCCVLICGCAKGEDDRPSVVCSSAILYDWVQNVLGEDADTWQLHTLGARGSDIHSYEPTVRDIALIARCDALIRIGGESESWAGKVIESARNDALLDLSLCDALGDMLYSGEEHGHDHSHDGHEHTYDEHIWFSPEYTYHSIYEIAQTLATIKPASAEIYRENARDYVATLTEIEEEYLTLRENTHTGRIVVADRFPFEYLCDMMGLAYSAAFEGCSAESEASFSVVSTLSRIIDEEGLGYVLVCESSDGKIARAVIEATKSKDARILILDSMQSLTLEDLEHKNYATQLRYNLGVLREALSK